MLGNSPFEICYDIIMKREIMEVVIQKLTGKAYANYLKKEE